MLSWLILFAGVGCSQKAVEFVPPPLQSPPPLESFVPDQNDKTNEPGFWMNRTDGEKLGIFFGHVHNVKEKWR